LSTQASTRTTPEIQAWVALLRAHATSIRRFNGEAKLREAAGTHVAGIRGFFRERFSNEEVVALGGLLERLPLDPAEDVSCTP